MKRIAILLLCAVLLLFLFINSWKSVRGTICDFDEKTGSMTVVAEDGQKYIVNDYLKHIPTGHLSRVNAQKSKNIFYEARMRAISSRKSCSEHR